MAFPIRGLFTGLTPAEKAYLLLHPHHIEPIKRDADKALAEARRRYPSGQFNDAGDAFRHCYWSALLARDIGADNALSFTGAHEEYGANPAGEKVMDLHNNAVGVGIGRANPGASDILLANLCVQALDGGQLITAAPSSNTGAYGY